jgi:hypothetical protein
LSFEADGAILAARYQDGTYRLWDLETNAKFALKLTGVASFVALSELLGSKPPPKLEGTSPNWLPWYLEACAGQAIGKDGDIVPITEEHRRMLAGLAAPDGTANPWRQWAGWTLAQAGKRSVWPGSAVSLDDFLLAAGEEGRLPAGLKFQPDILLADRPSHAWVPFLAMQQGLGEVRFVSGSSKEEEGGTPTGGTSKKSASPGDHSQLLKHLEPAGRHRLKLVGNGFQAPMLAGAALYGAAMPMEWRRAAMAESVEKGSDGGIVHSFNASFLEETGERTAAVRALQRSFALEANTARANRLPWVVRAFDNLRRGQLFENEEAFNRLSTGPNAREIRLDRLNLKLGAQTPAEVVPGLDEARFRAPGNFGVLASCNRSWEKGVWKIAVHAYGDVRVTIDRETVLEKYGDTRVEPYFVW